MTPYPVLYNKVDSMRKSIHGEWSSRWAFVLAATGSAVGLGNIWKFPYITGENGGGAFVLVYLMCVAAVGLPIMVAEILIGRRGRQSPINTMRTLAEEAGHRPVWAFVGWLGMLTGFVVLSYYSVIAGWAIAYVIRTGSGMFNGATAEHVNDVFTHFVGDPEGVLAWHTVFMVMTMLVVSRGVQGGLERATRYMMPALGVILVALVGFAMNTGYFDEGLAFLFRPDFHRITANGVMIAMGHAFFTLSLATGAIMIYGSYLAHDASIAKTSLMIAGADTVIALLAGMAIFPIVFANGLEPGQGAGLIFKTLPLAFGHMPGGTFFGTLFFILLVFAAWTSSISLIEPAVTYLVENRDISRNRATIVVGMACWVLGLATVFSFNVWQDEHPLSFIPLFRDKTIFDMLDYLSSNIMLPLGGLFTALFAGWFMTRASTREEIGEGDSWVYLSWRFVIRYVSPVAVIAVFLNLIGVF